MSTTLCHREFDSDVDVQDESDLVEVWSNGDLAKRIHKDDPASDTLVIRVLAARIAARADTCDDPLMILRNLSGALGSLRGATEAIAARHAEPDGQAYIQQALAHFTGAEAALDVLSGW